MEKENFVIVESNVDSNKIQNSQRKMGAIFIVGGILLIAIGIFFIGQSSSDMDIYMSVFFMVMGGFSLIMGFAYPGIMKRQIGSHKINVHEKYIEGNGLKSSGETKSLIEFNEKIDNISSVSKSGNFVVLNLKDGSSISIIADNADDIIIAIRNLLG